MPLFIAVHGGAGYHAVEDRKATKQALRTSVQAALGVSKTAGDSEVLSGVQGDTEKIEPTTTNADAEVALYAVEAAIRVLEDDPILNAGYGSNLTEAGTVECDAAIMSASSSAESESIPNALVAEFGSVAAAPGVRNSISAARAVLHNARRVDVLGRVPPLTLCGHGARDFARAHGVEVVPDNQLISDRARADWEYWSAQLRGSSSTESMPHAEGSTSRRLDAHQDTVGAVCLHIPSCGATSVAAGVSSGGLLLKHPGRIGEAAVYGAGCWAGPIGKLGAQGGAAQWWMACSVSGTGEAIVRANLAKSISEELDRAWGGRGKDCIVTTGSDEEIEDIEIVDSELDVHQILYDVLKKEFGSHGQAVGWDGCDKPTVGVLVMMGNGEIVRLYSAFTAAGMAIAYARDNSVRTHILSQKGGKSGSIYVETHTLYSRATNEQKD